MDTFDKLSKVLKPIQIDPLRDVRASLPASLGALVGTTDALKLVRKQLEATTFKGVHSSLPASLGALVGTTDALKLVRKQLEATTFKGVHSSLPASLGALVGTTDALKLIRKQLEATTFKGVHSSLPASLRALVGTTDALKLVRKQFELPVLQQSFRQPYLPHLEKFHQLTGALNPIFEELKKVRELYDKVQDNYVEEISMNADGSVTTAPTFPTVEEIKDIVENAIRDSGIGRKVETLEEGISTLTKLM